MCSQNLAGDHETEPRSTAERVECVSGWVLLDALVNDDAAARDGLVDLRYAYLADGDRCGDGHDGGGDKVLRGDAEVDVCGEDRAGDGRETRGHGEVQLGRRHEVDVGLHETRGLALANERRRGGYNSLGS